MHISGLQDFIIIQINVCSEFKYYLYTVNKGHELHSTIEHLYSGISTLTHVDDLSTFIAN